MTDRTRNLGLELIDFDFPRWHTKMHQILKQIDAAIGMEVPGFTLSGAWENGIAVSNGQIYLDSDDATIWKCNVTHTTPATGTFAQARAATAGRWTRVTGVPINRGSWAAGVSYNVGDIVEKDGAWYYCSAIHTSSILDNFPPVETEVWTLIFDTTGFGTSDFLKRDGSQAATGIMPFQEGINLNNQDTPTSPNNGDMWREETFIKTHLNGETHDLLHGGIGIRFDADQTLSDSELFRVNINMHQAWRNIYYQKLSAASPQFDFYVPAGISRLKISLIGKLNGTSGTLILYGSRDGGSSWVSGPGLYRDAAMDTYGAHTDDTAANNMILCDAMVATDNAGFIVDTELFIGSATILPMHNTRATFRHATNGYVMSQRGGQCLSVGAFDRIRVTFGSIGQFDIGSQISVEGLYD